MAQLPPSSILCALGSLLPRRPGGLAHSQPGQGTLEAWCPCPSKWAPPIVPGRSPSSAVCVLQSLCLRPQPYPRLHARLPPRWGSVWLYQALLATIFCSLVKDCLPHPSHPYYSALPSAGKPTTWPRLVSTGLDYVHHCSQLQTSSSGTNSHPSSRPHIPRSPRPAPSPAPHTYQSASPRASENRDKLPRPPSLSALVHS